MIASVWEENYKKGRFNRYPYEKVVSFIFSNFNDKKTRSSIAILDLGCGGGTHAKFLVDEGFSYWGVDGSPEAVKLTKERIVKATAATEVYECDFTSLPFEEECFDAVIDRQSLAHNTWPDILLIVEEIRRVLKVGGLYYGLFFSSGHPDLKWGKHLGNNDYDSFTDGIFKSSKFVHAFDPYQVKLAFRNFEMLKFISNKERDLMFDQVTSDMYEVVMKKK